MWWLDAKDFLDHHQPPALGAVAGVGTVKPPSLKNRPQPSALIIVSPRVIHLLLSCVKFEVPKASPTAGSDGATYPIIYIGFLPVENRPARAGRLRYRGLAAHPSPIRVTICPRLLPQRTMLFWNFIFFSNNFHIAFCLPKGIAIIFCRATGTGPVGASEMQIS